MLILKAGLKRFVYNRPMHETRLVSCRAATLFAIAIALASFTGCYPDWPEHAGTAVIHGNITLDGLPLGNANVAFVPIGLHANDTDIMPIAYGKTDAGGDFNLAYSDETKEVMAGRYNVIISKIESSNEQEPNSPPPGLIPESMKNFQAFQSQGEQVPAIYNRDSSLIYEIIASPGIVSPKFGAFIH